MKTVGVIGLGIMGGFCSSKLMEKGFSVAGYDVVPESCAKAKEKGVNVCANSAELAKVADAVILFLPKATHCREALFGANGLLTVEGRCKLVINMSTVDPDSNKEFSKLAHEKGVGFIDAPVLGSPTGVGAWALPVGGSEEDVAEAKEILFALCGGPNRFFPVGAIGNGNTLKILNNMMLGAINACAAETLSLAQKIGLSPKLLLDVAIAANARVLSSAYKEAADRFVNEHYDEPTFALDMLIKDNRLCMEMAEKNNAPLVLAPVVDYIHSMAAARGYGKLDHAVATKVVTDNWKKLEG